MPRIDDIRRQIRVDGNVPVRDAGSRMNRYVGPVDAIPTALRRPANVKNSLSSNDVVTDAIGVDGSLDGDVGVARRWAPHDLGGCGARRSSERENRTRDDGN
ncbi:MAG: hypothetical protein M3Y18_00060 [Candidatus Eremiobacteraeota bacterium]|nr:hypothetical protein [Candidatus Eremiobacteraeota bacterium]